jgi:hypothetical protein
MTRRRLAGRGRRRLVLSLARGRNGGSGPRIGVDGGRRVQTTRMTPDLTGDRHHSVILPP